MHYISNKYCTYITFYRGNQLPPFYIGYTSVNKINRGYNGSVSSKKYKGIWKQERAERPHLFHTVILRTFDTHEEALEHEERLLLGLRAHKNDLYINMHVSDKRFTRTGPPSEEHRKKIVEAKKKNGQDPEIIRKMSEAAKKKWQDPEISQKMHDGIKKAAQSMTPEERSARAKKGHETKRLNRLNAHAVLNHSVTGYQNHPNHTPIP